MPNKGGLQMVAATGTEIKNLGQKLIKFQGQECGSSFQGQKCESSGDFRWRS